MPQHHGMSPFQQLLEASAQKGTHQGFFGRLLPKGQVVERKNVEDALLKLANSMDEGDNEDPSGDSDIPDGYVFLGQFIDHDITFDTTSGLNKVFGDVESIPNIRTPIFDLDSVYGDGPEAIPFLYQRKHKDFFLIGSENNPDNDLPRNREGRALIPESRNDENGIISQLQLLFMKFHNAVLEGIENEDIEIFEPVQHKDVEFEKAKRAVQRHYQWIVRHDFLPRIIVKEVLDQAVQDVLDSDNYKSDPIWCDAPTIPVEFAGAAYRFGHTLTRSHYHINANRLNVDLFENFKDKPGNALSVFNAVAPENIVDWRFFFEVDSSIEPQKARKIDTWMAHEFYDLPFVPKAAKDRGENSLAFRNLLRGAVSYSLPSGEEVAKAFGVNPIPLHQKVKDAGLTETPFWFYCLAEAEAHGGKLGPVGGRIVAMTLLRILKEDPESYVNAPKPWKPYLGEGDNFTMADLVKFVQKHEPKKEAIKFGEEFYLKSQDGRYLISADHSGYYFPRLDASGQVKLKLGNGNGELTHNAIVQILSTETGLAQGNILGAFRDRHNCYYWSLYNQQMQGWQITKVDGGDAKIRYGDKVYLTNLYWTNQRLTRDTKYPGYFTTVENAQEWWVLEKAEAATGSGGAYT